MTITRLEQYNQELDNFSKLSRKRPLTEEETERVIWLAHRVKSIPGERLVRQRIREKLTPEGIERRRSYLREWRKNNPEVVEEYKRRYVNSRRNRNRKKKASS